MAPRPFLGPAHAGPGLDHAAIRGLFDVPGQRVVIVDDDAGNRTLEQNEVTEAIFDFDKKGTAAEHRRLTPNAEGLLFVPERGKYPVIFTPNDEYTEETVQLAVMTPELEGVIAYLQKLGMNRGKWRDLFEPQLLGVRVRHAALRGVDRPRQGGLRAALRGLPWRRGRRQRPGGDVHVQVPPRDFQLAVFKFRLVKGPLPTDGDLMRTITRGIRGTAMPPWHSLPIEDRLAAIQYIKYQLAVDRSDPARLRVLRRPAPGTAALHRFAPAASAGAARSRQGGAAPSQMLGVPRRFRQGRRRKPAASRTTSSSRSARPI